MALIERLMHWGANLSDTAPPAFEPEERRLSVHAFYAASIEMALGEMTVASFKTAINTTAADNADLDALIALVPGSQAGKAQFVHEIHAVLLLAEGRFTGYTTPALVRTRLGI